jgi:osmoprotectant transport system ATP-binding protein
MISFESVTKQFPDGTMAANELTFEVPRGEMTVFVGPSGCGKSTTLRMTNRMIEPTSGRISVDGRDIKSVPAHQLRLDIGYVIQQVGLFPHFTISDNIATVPNLIGWDKQRTQDRVEELIDTVGLSRNVAGRYPAQLSGGQEQRVGVARALAADPSIMLMDEPFGAVDPIMRTLLQDEFLRLQQELHKTILFVTHDIDEAIKIGDRIAVFSEGGVLEQYTTPTTLLASPANDFVVDFLGPERNLKRLALIPTSAIKVDTGPCVSFTDTSEQAVAVARKFATSWVLVVNGERGVEGWIPVSELEEKRNMDKVPLQPFHWCVQSSDSLRAALDLMVEAPTGAVARVDSDGHYEGTITQETFAAGLE